MTILSRHIHDVAAMCCPNPTPARVNRLTSDLLEEVKEDRLIPLTVGDLVDSGILTEAQIEMTGVAFQSKLQVAGHRQDERPLSPGDIYRRSKSNFVSRAALEVWARAEDHPINIKGWK